uniref:Tubulin--tyrosine ligase-like protein 5 n=1 Tax=Percolomonas cosmopolitus TaxID=63605 RepID=A0A7S1PHT8_9EUKA
MLSTTRQFCSTASRNFQRQRQIDLLQSCTLNSTLSSLPSHVSSQSSYYSIANAATSVSNTSTQPSTTFFKSESTPFSSPLLESGRSWFEIESLFKNKPSTIKCSSIKNEKLSQNQNLNRVHLPNRFVDKQPYYRISRFNYHSLRQVLLRSGFRRLPLPEPQASAVPPDQPAQAGMVQRDAAAASRLEQRQLKVALTDPDHPWNLFWGRHLPVHMYKHFNPFQKVNHFPGTTTIGRKDAMAQNLDAQAKRMNWRHNHDKTFYPRTFDLPSQMDALKKDMQENPSQKYILKPSAASCGRGISILRAGDFSKLPHKDEGSYVIQHYIDNPHLINGLKYDLRLYVGVSSFNPLKVYLFPDGLTRFATEPYTDNIGNIFSQLTNYSINKHSSTFVKNIDEEDDDMGSKWSVRALQEYFEEQGIDHRPIWSNIEEIIVKTLISCEDTVNSKIDSHLNPKHDNCFEFFGFDVMFDENLKPWLIEVNLLPSLSIPTPIDKKIKMNALGQMFDIVGMTTYDRTNLEKEIDRCFHYVPGYEPYSELLGGKSTKSSLLGEYNQKGSFSPGSLMNLDSMSSGGNVPESIFTPEQNYVIQNAEDELHRKGEYKRIFPPQDGDLRRYDDVFAESRSHNETLVQWEELKQQHLLRGGNMRDLLKIVE